MHLCVCAHDLQFSSRGGVQLFVLTLLQQQQQQTGMMMYDMERSQVRFLVFCSVGSCCKQMMPE